MEAFSAVLESLKGGLIVSCQARPDSPMNDPSIISALAVCAQEGGAVGIRADGPENIRWIKKRVSIPVVGIYKVYAGEGRPAITPAYEHAREISQAGADMVAFEATFQTQPDKEALEQFVRQVRKELEVPVMADVSTLEEGVRAWEVGSDLVATTLSGYTRASADRAKPDLQLVEELSETGMRVVCEGNIRTPEQAGEAISRGAWAVVVGTAITDPTYITSWFAGSVSGAVHGRGRQK